MSVTERTGPTRDTATPESPTTAPGPGCIYALLFGVIIWLVILSGVLALALAWKG